MERKQRDPYTEFTPEELQAIFGGDPAQVGGPGGPPAPIFAREHRPSAKYREFEGDARNHCTMAGGKTWFYGCKIYTDGWAEVSTDAAQGYVYVEANDCDIKTRSGYAAYADNGCYDVFNTNH